jgi:phosphate transport system protein
MMGAMGREHTSKVYEHELRTLSDKILLMGSLVEEMLRKSILALTTRDEALAMDAMRTDRRINRLECEVDELALKILATRQPVASDLRFITMSLKIVTDLERMGDLGVNICERVIELGEEPPMELPAGVRALATEAIDAVHGSLDALVARDVALATRILEQDDVIDEHYSTIFEGILRLMARDPTAIYRATRVQSIAKYLERVGDHAMNVAETVVFLVNGKDIRHHKRLADGASDLPGARTRGPGSHPPPGRKPSS